MFKISQILEQYTKEYKDIIFEEESNNSKIFSAFNIIEQRSCILKVINKNDKNCKDITSFLKEIKREEEITTLCKSEYTVNLYRKLETEDYIIFEFENFETTALDYLYENGPLKRKLDFFKYLVQQLAYAIKVLHQKGIMHRNINPQNIFLNTEDEKKEIKLGDFSCSVHIKDNKSEQVGNFLFSSPEIIGGLEYNEKCDLWSLGATLFFLYFGHLPYSENLSINTIKNIVLDFNNNFMIKKTNIPTLDILFKRLLVINPDYRMTYEEFFDYVFSEDFMKKDIICVNNNLIYKKLYDDILKEPKRIIMEDNHVCDIDYCSDYQRILLFRKIIPFVQDLIPDIMTVTDQLEEGYNNIIYYDENNDYISSVQEDCDYFEKHTKGAFIFCTNLESLRLVRNEILDFINL
jgi:serine/threonine protein kinase